jgi:Tol biopolymer transport system component
MSASQPRPFTIEDALSVKYFHHHGPIRFSPDGRLMAYSLEDQSGDEPCAQLWVTDVATGHAQRILPKALTAWGPSWSPIEGPLAFYADTGEGQQLWIWHPQTGVTRRVSEAIIAAEDWARLMAAPLCASWRPQPG